MLELFEVQEPDNSDYDLFVDKFKPKLTTDDCYTPTVVMQAVVDYVGSIYPIDNLTIMRPFKPGGAYEKETYDENCIVIDNPPFSIITQICCFYKKRGIKFFLFAPQLTLFNPGSGFSYIISDSTIIYANGANVKTSFITNIFNEPKIIGSYALHRAIKEAQKKEEQPLPTYVYPCNVLTVSRIAKIVNKGVDVEVSGFEVVHIRQLDSQKTSKKSIFGTGFLISDKSGMTIKAAEAKAAEAKAAEAKAAEGEAATEWKISERERQIINYLNLRKNTI